jgi:hypothetical protein
MIFVQIWLQKKNVDNFAYFLYFVKSLWCRWFTPNEHFPFMLWEKISLPPDTGKIFLFSSLQFEKANFDNPCAITRLYDFCVRTCIQQIEVSLVRDASPWNWELIVQGRENRKGNKKSLKLNMTNDFYIHKPRLYYTGRQWIVWIINIILSRVQAKRYVYKMTESAPF